MKSEVIVSILIGISGTTLFTWLLVHKELGAPSYAILMSILALVCLVIPVFQRLRELDLKNLKLTLDKIQEAKAEVFAKEEDLKESALLLVELIAANSAVTGIFGDKDSNKYSKALIRKKAKDLLKNIHVPDEKIEEVFKYQKALENIPREPKEEHDKKWNEFIEMLKKESGN
jgi:hypothetical protein